MGYFDRQRNVVDSSNLNPVEGDGSDVLIYVRPTGNDSSGIGSLGSPYRTIKRALEDLPYLPYGNDYVIECTGLGTDSYAEPLQFPPLHSPDGLTFGSTRVSGFTLSRSVTIEAAPTLDDTITGGELTGQTAEPTTGLITLNTTKSYLVDEKRGKLVRDSTGRIAVIASNTAGPNTDIEITDNNTLTAPIEILDQSCEIRNSDASGGNALEIRNAVCGVQLNGIRLSTANPFVFRYGLFLDNHLGAFGLRACSVDGLFAALGTSQPSFSASYFEKRFSSSGVGLNCFNCMVDGASLAFRTMGRSTDVSFWLENIFDGCSPIGVGTGIEDVNHLSISMDRTIVRNGSGNGVEVIPGGQMTLRRGLVDSNAGDGVLVRGSNLSVVRDVQGSGNTGLGVRLTNGALVQRLDGTAVTGTGGDYQVGGNGVGTWGAFGGDENDLAAGTPQICRMYT